jgi:hypothetical protein
MKAFPSTEPIYRENVIGIKQSNGMDLRDYFAGQAMQGMLSGLLADGLDINWAKMARDSYFQADAMMEARNDNK